MALLSFYESVYSQGIGLYGICVNDKIKKASFAFEFQFMETNGTTNRFRAYLVDLFTGDKYLYSTTSTTGIAPSTIQHYSSTLIGGNKEDWHFLDLVDFPTWCVEHLATYHNVPIYKDNTLISYTDGTYEVIDAVLTERQAKDHAYTNLLNTYGTFYKANEVDISGAYKKQI
jgi:hypothetical protein